MYQYRLSFCNSGINLCCSGFNVSSSGSIIRNSDSNLYKFRLNLYSHALSVLIKATLRTISTAIPDGLQQLEGLFPDPDTMHQTND
jgi:hypothetical protein